MYFELSDRFLASWWAIRAVERASPPNHNRKAIFGKIIGPSPAPRTSNHKGKVTIDAEHQTPMKIIALLVDDQSTIVAAGKFRGAQSRLYSTWGVGRVSTGCLKREVQRAACAPQSSNLCVPQATPDFCSGFPVLLFCCAFAAV